MIGAGEESDSLSRLDKDPHSRLDLDDLPIDLDGGRPLVLRGGMLRPDSDRERAEAGDDVLFLHAVGVGGGCHSFLRVHQLFAVLRLFGKVHQNQATLVVVAKADELAYRSMLLAAYALVRTRFLALQDEPNKIVEEFRRTFYDTKLFFDQYAGGKFANYLFDRHENPPTHVDVDVAKHTLDEAQLFIEACYSAEAKVNGSIIGLSN